MSPDDPTPRETSAEAEPHAAGVASAIVRENKDPAGAGRVKVSFPWHSRPEESFWARVAAPIAGAGGTVVFVPAIGDEVLVAFERGDLRFPCVIGSLWNSGSPPPVRVTFDRQRLEIDDGHGNSVTIDSAAGRITIQAAASLALKAPQISIEASGTVDVKSAGTLTVRGSLVHIN